MTKINKYDLFLNSIVGLEDRIKQNGLWGLVTGVVRNVSLSQFGILFGSICISWLAELVKREIEPLILLLTHAKVEKWTHKMVGDQRQIIIKQPGDIP